jgi:hypothetical protein
MVEAAGNDNPERGGDQQTGEQIVRLTGMGYLLGDGTLTVSAGPEESAPEPSASYTAPPAPQITPALAAEALSRMFEITPDKPNPAPGTDDDEQR